MNTIFIVSLEPIESRYTCQWYDGLPKELDDHIKKHDKKFNIYQINGEEVEQATSNGAFINFTNTNAWKSQQAIEVSKLFAEGKVRDGDRFLFTDAWNPAIFMVKYMVELLGIKAELHGIWHAGSYDPQDFLGRLIRDKRWSLSMEASMFHALDYNYFATKFHIKLFRDNVLRRVDFEFDHNEANRKMVLSGQPHNLLMEHLKPYQGMKKGDLILFPHRVAPEKQPEIFRDLAKHLPEYEFVVCQDKQLSKDEYHKLLGESKIVFSANLQETLGIGQAEAIFTGAISMCPNRLSYREMYLDEFKYPSEWTIDWDSYVANRDSIIAAIRNKMDGFESYADSIEQQRSVLVERYFSADVMFERLLGK